MVASLGISVAAVRAGDGFCLFRHRNSIGNQIVGIGPGEILTVLMAVYTAAVIFIAFSVLWCGTFGSYDYIFIIGEDFTAAVTFLICVAHSVSP